MKNGLDGRGRSIRDVDFGVSIPEPRNDKNPSLVGGVHSSGHSDHLLVIVNGSV